MGGVGMAAGPEQLDTGETPPWERPGAVRRDAEPHRGDLLVGLADLAFIMTMLSFVLLLPLLIAVPLAVVARVLAGRDLDHMGSGHTDREGEHRTRLAWEKSRNAILLSGLATLWWTMLLSCCLSVAMR
jgi:hypothetical protein